jgi:hypothetical protein
MTVLQVQVFRRWLTSVDKPFSRFCSKYLPTYSTYQGLLLYTASCTVVLAVLTMYVRWIN